MKALVVNCSAPHYNLGALKLAAWLRDQGHDVTVTGGDPGFFVTGYDLVCLSVIFSWHAPMAKQIAWRVKGASDVWCGGPGMFALEKWWREEVGTPLVRGVDPRFDRQRGPYKMTFASRGCPVGCSFCIVPRMEGLTFTLNWDFEPAPILCDNNLSALPDEFQEHIIGRYAATNVRLLDANSGFEPRSFTEETYRRWRPALHGPWRFAFDEQAEAREVEAMMQILRDVKPRMKRVYVLIGNEPVASCYERAEKVIEWGAEPYVQYVLPLNWLGDVRALKHRFDWTQARARAMTRYYNKPGLWHAVPIWEYTTSKKRASLFAFLKKAV